MSDEVKKLYYGIREVSELTGIKQYVLRYWESEFDILRPLKNRSGNRAYTEEDIENIRRIQTLLHHEKYTIEGAKKKMATSHPESQKTNLRGLLHSIRTSLRSALGEME